MASTVQCLIREPRLEEGCAFISIGVCQKREIADVPAAIPRQNVLHRFGAVRWCLFDNADFDVRLIDFGVVRQEVPTRFGCIGQFEISPFGRAGTICLDRYGRDLEPRAAEPHVIRLRCVCFVLLALGLQPFPDLTLQPDNAISAELNSARELACGRCAVCPNCGSHSPCDPPTTCHSGHVRYRCETGRSC